MDKQLAALLIELSKPENIRPFIDNPDLFLANAGVSDVDKKLVISRHRNLIRYQSKFGDLSEEQISNLDFGSFDSHSDVDVDLHPNHEHDIEHDIEDRDTTTNAIKRNFGPHSRYLSRISSEPTSKATSPSRPNWLAIVGTGLGVAHLTREALGWIGASDILLYCVADAATELYLQDLKASFEDLYQYYGDGKLRRETYAEMTGRILEVLREGKNVCAAYYGHPGMFVKPGHAAIEQARSEGYAAWMCPGVSSIDCLIADLGIDLSWDGCQVFEATQFLLRARKPDINAGLILLQIGCIGDSSFNARGFDKRHVPILVRKLIKYYGEEHEVVLYEASPFPICSPRIDIVSLNNIEARMVSGITSMYVPPKNRARYDQKLSKYFRENQPEYP